MELPSGQNSRRIQIERVPNSVSEDQKGRPRGSDGFFLILGINQLLVGAEGPSVV